MWQPQPDWKPCGDRECPDPWCWQRAAYDEAVEAWEDAEFDAGRLPADYATGVRS